METPDANKLFTQERQQAILKQLEKHHKATVAGLCELFNVSPATIRTDLRELERANLITRTHGGALWKSKTGLEMLPEEKSEQNESAKLCIAKLALERVEDGDTLLLDSGSTVLELAKLLHTKKNLTVITNDFQIAFILEEMPESVVNLFLIGGLVRPRLHCSIPVDESSPLHGLTIDKAFMGANGFSINIGASTPDLRHANFKRKMLSNASNIILLVDDTKLGRNAFAQFAELSCIDILITNRISAKDKACLEKNSLMVISGESSDYSQLC